MLSRIAELTKSESKRYLLWSSVGENWTLSFSMCRIIDLQDETVLALDISEGHTTE